MAEKKTAKKPESSDKTFKASDIKFQAKTSSSRSKYKHDKFSRKEILLGLVLVLFLAIPVVFFAFSGEEMDVVEEEKFEAISYCKEDEVIKNVFGKKYKKYDEITDQIETNDNFELDINCLIILTYINLNTSNSEKAQYYIDLINKNNNYKSSYISGKYSDSLITLEELQEKINIINEQQEQSTQYVDYGVIVQPDGEASDE